MRKTRGRIADVGAGVVIVLCTGIGCSALMNDFHVPWLAVPVFVVCGCSGLYFILRGLLD